MADRAGVLNKYNSLMGQFGRAALSSFFPNDVEYYLCAFELVSSLGTEGYFLFPIQPSALSKSELTRTNIKKSMSGITVLKNSSFIPQEISIKGNFGRRFKILANLNGVSFTSTNNSIKNGIRFDVPTLSNSIKTGYGATKILQKIVQESNNVDSLGKPKQLYFYNLGFGESYLVTIPPSGFSFMQTEDQNMIWIYNINMSILAPLSEVASSYDNVQSASRSILSRGAITAGINTVANNVKRML